MHFSITASKESQGTVNGLRTYPYVNEAISAAQKIMVIDGCYTNVIIKMHHEGNVTHVYNVEPDGIERLEQHPEWLPMNDEGMEYIGSIDVKDIEGEYHDFELVHDDNFIVFSGACNVGLLQSGSYQKDDCFSLDENLYELHADLECLVNGESPSSELLHNERSQTESTIKEVIK